MAKEQSQCHVGASRENSAIAKDQDEARRAMPRPWHVHVMRHSKGQPDEEREAIRGALINSRIATFLQRPAIPRSKKRAASGFPCKLACASRRSAGVWRSDHGVIAEGPGTGLASVSTVERVRSHRIERNCHEPHLRSLNRRHGFDHCSRNKALARGSSGPDTHGVRDTAPPPAHAKTEPKPHSKPR